MDVHADSVPGVTINLNIFGDGNKVNAGGRDVNLAPPPPPTVRLADPSTTRASSLRWGTYAAAAASFVTGALLSFTVPQPPPARPSAWPAQMTALCNDGQFSGSRNRSGTCSGHDGVAHWRYAATDSIWR
jgi:hypothetical protein